MSTATTSRRDCDFCMTRSRLMCSVAAGVQASTSRNMLRLVGNSRRGHIRSRCGYLFASGWYGRIVGRGPKPLTFPPSTACSAQIVPP